MADISERTRFSWPVVVALVLAAVSVAGAGIRGESTRDMALENKAEIKAVQALRDVDRDALNEVRRELSGMSAKLDLLLQRSDSVAPAAYRGPR